MWKVKLPDNTKVLEHVKTAFTYADENKKYNFSALEITEIDKLYSHYDSVKAVACAELEGLALGKNLLNAIHTAYNETQQGGRLNFLRNELLLNAITCPCCGISVPDELDHYLPKEDYRGLSIYVRNLIPYCHKCNNKKRTVSGLNPEERFINAYFDDLPMDKQFFFAKAILNGKNLRFEFQVHKIDGLDDQLVTQMNFQMTRVDLRKRLGRELNNYFSLLSSFVQVAYEIGGKLSVQKNLELAAKKQIADFGINHWRHAVIAALAEHDGFCDGGFYEPWSLARPDSV